jgi:hypothetical protein
VGHCCSRSFEWRAVGETIDTLVPLQYRLPFRDHGGDVARDCVVDVKLVMVTTPLRNLYSSVHLF